MGKGKKMERERWLKGLTLWALTVMSSPTLSRILKSSWSTRLRVMASNDVTSLWVTKETVCVRWEKTLVSVYFSLVLWEHVRKYDKEERARKSLLLFLISFVFTVMYVFGISLCQPNRYSLLCDYFTNHLGKMIINPLHTCNALNEGVFKNWKKSYSGTEWVSEL